MLKILIAHNYYQQSGGEDTVFESEVALLRTHGHEVVVYTDDNDRVIDMSRVSVALQTIWSKPSYNNFASLLAQEKPDVVHFHNTFPLISPAAYYACRRAGVAVVQSLDNPRLLCPAATFYRENKLCLDCLGKTPPWSGVLHGCYHQSRLHSAVVASMLTIHRWAGTWENKVNIYLVATNFYRQIFAQGGLPEEKLAVKPHFIQSDPGLSEQPGNYALFLARLDQEKGVRVMLEAWKHLNIPLKIRGSGQLENETRAFIQQNGLKNVELVSRLSKDELERLIKNARFLVWPAEGYYETFGMATVECYAAGVPVVASRIGVMTELVHDGKTGLLFNPGDANDLADKVRWLWDHPEDSMRMGKAARREYEQKYTPERNYQLLMDIYSKAIAMSV